jgi:hypothetical protein
MAYEHFMTLDTEAERVKEIHAQAASMCEQAAAEQCVILASQLETGSAPSANAKLRGTPAGINQIMNDLGAPGRVVAQSLKGEDLATPISDSTKKVQLLGDYCTRMEALGNQAGAELDSLIRLNRELAEVQSQIEALSGERAHLEQRVATQILNLDITASGAISAWAPVSEALADFTGNLADATSALVTLVAFTLPWAIAVALVIWAGRKWKWLRALRSDTR